MPRARAPSTSSTGESPTMAAVLGLDLEHLEHGPEDRRARLHLAVHAGGDPRVHVEREVAHEGVEVAARVGDEADPEAVPAGRGEHGSASS